MRYYWVGPCHIICDIDDRVLHDAVDQLPSEIFVFPATVYQY
jgi:hypothetical protein